MTTNPTTPYVLDFGDPIPLRVDLPLPDGATTVHGLLPAIFALSDGVTGQALRHLEALGTSVQCRKGCDSCCHQLVPISMTEAVHLADVVRNMMPDVRASVIQRFTATVTRLDEAKLLSDMASVFAHQAHDWKAVLRLKQRYHALHVPCPFLEKSACLIHAHRPLACRQYFVTSPPNSCGSLYADADQPQPVHQPLDIGGALAAFSGEGLQRSRVVPLALSLLAERSERTRSFPTLPAEQMMGRFINLLTECFTG